MRAHSESRPGPLVEPLPEDVPIDAVRASRQLALPGFGEVAQRRLANSRVLVIGAGGLGCSTVPLLAGAGVGTIGLIDDDVVELSNLHRQITHRTADLGCPKVAALAEVVAGLNDAVHVETHPQRLTAENAAVLFARYDLVIDGSDNFETRYLSNDTAHAVDRPLVWGAISQYAGQVGVAWHRYGPGYRDVFPEPPGADGALSCAAGGVLPSVCGVIGSLLANESLKLLTGLGEPLLGRVLVFDALRARMREVRVARDPLAAVQATADHAPKAAAAAEAAA